MMRNFDRIAEENSTRAIQPLNKLILDYNLRVPSLMWQQAPLSVKLELSAALTGMENS
jgi:hypothetical protein